MKASWLTPNVVAIAAAVKCSECNGRGGKAINLFLQILLILSGDPNEGAYDNPCKACRGSGLTDDRALWLILADALEEAGCTDAAILNQCRNCGSDELLEAAKNA